MLNSARDWEVLCDLDWESCPGSVFVFPQDVALTNAKPDLIIVSRLNVCFDRIDYSFGGEYCE